MTTQPEDLAQAQRLAGRILVVTLAALLALGLASQGATPAAAAPGDLVADLIVAEYPNATAPSVAFDGHYLYHVDYGGSVLHRVDVPPAGGPYTAFDRVDVPITGASSGIMTLSYDAGRDAFWAVSGDGLSIYLLRKSGAAGLAFTIDTANDLPGYVPAGDFPNETKVAYDRADDTIWFSRDAGTRIYHFHTYADAQGTAALVAETPYIDVNLAPNDMVSECGYSQSSGVAVGGSHLFITVAGCGHYFEYSKTGGKVASYAYNPYLGNSPQDLECDNLSYGVPVFWLRDGYDGHVRAYQQPAAAACLYGGGALPKPAGLDLSAPSAARAGEAFLVGVTAKNADGTTATGYTGTVHFTSSDASSGVVLPPDSTLANGQRISVAINAAPASRFVLASSASPVAGTSFGFTVTAQDQFGNTDPAFAGTLHFTSTDSSAGVVLPANATLTNGQGGFSSTLIKAGSQTITATDMATATIIGTLGVTVRAAPASGLALASTATPTAGSSFSFTVSAQDQFGNTDTAYAGTVHFTSSDSSAGVVLPADSTLTNGQGAFSATLIKAGSQTITGTDRVTATITGTVTLTVRAANAASLVLDAPGSARAGQAFNVTVTLKDQYGNVATGYRGTVHFTTSDPLPTVSLPADYTFTAADDGVRGFQIRLWTPPSQTVRASDPADPTLTQFKWVNISLL
ncbi:MAG: hypothetical protein E6G64_12045 [Actinobacteria bacterium]|nr:MAG: hypothetical protein E6G64_12045 [Actinomycetota bacterium]